MLPTVMITIISVANLCLLMTAALYPDSESLQVVQSRRTAGLTAVFLGLVGQSLYLLLFGWTYFHPEDRIGHLWVTAGVWCSISTFIVALFGHSLKRYAGLASGFTTFFLRGWAGFGNLLTGH
jgi:hypothetical protein